MATERWNIDIAHSNVEFVARHLVVTKVRGHFGKWSGHIDIDIDADDITKARAEATFEVDSIDTREPQRDTHLKSEDFLHAEKFPALSFHSTGIKRKAAGALEVTGDLTIRGVTRSVIFDVDGPTPPAKDPWGNMKAGLSATTKINRKDYGLNWNAALEAGGILVGDEVAITLEVELLKA